MRYVFLIALREFAENAKTKGFWIGIFMLPLIIGVSILVSTKLSKAEPSRHFVVVDKSGAFETAVRDATEWAHQRSVLQALGDHVRGNLAAGQTPDLDLSGNQGAVDAFIAAGGSDAYLSRLRPLLRADTPEFKQPARRFVLAGLPPDVDAGGGTEEILAQLEPYLTGERRLRTDAGIEEPLFAALVIRPEALDETVRWTAAESPIQYWSTNLAVDNLPELLRNALNGENRRRMYVARGVEPASVREIEHTWLRFDSFDPAKAEGSETVSVADRIVRNVPVAFVYLLWLSLFSIMQMLLNNTIEEKSNRIAEVLLSSVTPGEIMMGKLLGIAGIGLTMVGAWLTTVFVAARLYLGSGGAGADFIGPAVDAVMASGLVPIFLLCFVLGYLIYAGLFLTIGALCNDLKEAQNAQGPLMLIMMVPLFTMMFVNRDPHGTVATILTWIPLYTPFTMMNRAAADPPLLELIGATLLMLATAGLLLWSAGRIFRIGILRAGNRPRFVEVLKWIRGREDG
jgi:ABC-2 type transport system permease protein